MKRHTTITTAAAAAAAAAMGMYLVAVVLQYTIQYSTIHKITHTHSKQYTTQKLQTQ
jgi:hypothetical protein